MGLFDLRKSLASFNVQPLDTPCQTSYRMENNSVIASASNGSLSVYHDYDHATQIQVRGTSHRQVIPSVWNSSTRFFVV